MVIWSADPCMLVYPSPGRRKHIIIIRLINKRGVGSMREVVALILLWSGDGDGRGRRGRGRTHTGAG